MIERKALVSLIELQLKCILTAIEKCHFKQETRIASELHTLTFDLVRLDPQNPLLSAINQLIRDKVFLTFETDERLKNVKALLIVFQPTKFPALPV